MDALNCQKATAKQIIAQGADYLLTVKDNQPTLAQDLEELFATAAQEPPSSPVDRASTVEKGHGRLEERDCAVIQDQDYLFYMHSAHKEWPELHSLVKVDSHRIINGQEQCHTRYFISSLTCDASTMLRHVRAHWSIENSLHWVLDVTMNEDMSRVRKANAPQNLATIRRIAINLVKTQKIQMKGRPSVRRAMKRAAYLNSSLEQILVS